MAWILDEYSKFHGHSPAVVTGKPIVSHFFCTNTYSKLFDTNSYCQIIIKFKVSHCLVFKNLVFRILAVP